MLKKAIEIKPKLFPALTYFAMPEGYTCVIDISKKWDKRDKSTHRYAIADVNGNVQLTIPLEKPLSFTEARLGDIRLSRHGQWWHVHRITLESAYGRTPYFEHYFPSLQRFFSHDTVNEYPFLYQYLLETYKVISNLLKNDTSYSISDSAVNAQTEIIAPTDTLAPYHQIRQQQLGFIPGLSVLDILFNIGPEAQLYLRTLRNNPG